MASCSPSLLLLSTSKVHGGQYLEYCSSVMKQFLDRRNIKEILFLPYALKNHDEYAETAQKAFEGINIELKSIHKEINPIKAIAKAEAIFIGGGNTFLLLKTLYEECLIEPIRNRVLQGGLCYIGASAGTNVATKSISTTNDMPIVYPPSFEALKLVPFNINPHYLDENPSSTHMGETREQRIKQYHEMPHSAPVIGLREGSWLLMENHKLILEGLKPSRLFISGQPPKEIDIGTDLSFLLNSKEAVDCC